MKMKRVIAIALLMSVSACSFAGNAGDYVTLQGTPKGMQAFGDFLNGAVRTGKESPDRPSEYFAHRNTQEAHDTQRHAQGFWQKLVQ
jgi:hypothetical protein